MLLLLLLLFSGVWPALACRCHTEARCEKKEGEREKSSYIPSKFCRFFCFGSGRVNRRRKTRTATSISAGPQNTRALCVFTANFPIKIDSADSLAGQVQMADSGRTSKRKGRSHTHACACNAGASG